MWPTSTGNRTLQGAEATLVAAAIIVMLDAFDEHLAEDDDDEFAQPSADMQLGIAVFDSLTIPQRIAMLHHVSKHLLSEAAPLSEETSAIEDATIAAIFSEIQDQVAIEIGLDPEHFASESHSDNELFGKMTYWRTLVLNAFRHTTAGDEDVDDLDLPRDCMEDSLSAWESLIDLLASAILWDRDFELADGFMDEDPSSARQRRRLMGIHDNYFVEPPPDPTVHQTRLLLTQARSLASRRPR
ncbi:MAG: hypothetical protein ACO1RT_12505 [Planctomycetaceae bacterium]